MSRLLRGVLVACVAVSRVPAAMATPAAEDTANTVRYFSVLAVAPDGAGLAYGVAEAGDLNGYVLYFRDSRSGKTQRLPGQAPLTAMEQGMDTVPSWSPDGKFLAYVDVESGKGRLRLWNRVRNTSSVADGVYACSRSTVCVRDVVQWSPDGGKVYFLGTRTAASPRRDITIEGVGAQVDNGVSVRTTSAKMQGLGELRVSSADIFAYTVATQRVEQLTSDGEFGNFRLSPNGALILATDKKPQSPRGSKQVLHNYYVLRTTSTAKLPKPVTVARQWQSVLNWSPDNRRVAFTESGGQTDGDVLVLDVKSGTVSVLTPGRPFGNVSDFDRTASTARNYGYPGTKFGNSLEAPKWTSSGSGVLVSRVSMEDGRRRTRLWSIDFPGGKLTRLSGDDRCDLIDFKTRARRSEIAMLEQCDGTIRASLLDLADHAVRPVQSFLAARPRIFEWLDDDLYLTIENATSAPEIASLSLASGAMKTLTSVNQGVKPGDVKVRTIEWTTSDGRAVVAPLYYRENAHQSLIIHLYPPNFFSFSAPALNAFPNPRIHLSATVADLVEHGYAVLDRPTIMPAGNGNTCARLGPDMEEALDAVARTNLVDASSAGIYGHSFGGYAVNCVITRTNRFKAAVSVAGLSDLISMYFTTVGGDSFSGGGQVGSMGGTLWEAPLRYWQDSPVSGVSTVETPLLLIHGALDRQVPVTQGREMFEALSNLGKDVTLVEYADGDHGFSFIGTEDFRKRVSDFFDARLRMPMAPIDRG